MRIVVTGASGFLGRHLVRALAAAGHTGLAVARRPMEGLPAGWQARERAVALSAAGDEPRPDALIHLEVKQHILRVTEADRAEFTRVNVDGTRQWLDWCAARGVGRVMFFSSVKALATAEGGEPGPYGRSKQEAEVRVAAWAEQDPARAAVIVRPAVVYGAGSVDNMTTMVRAIERGWFVLPGAAQNLKPIVSVRNLCAAVVFLLERAGPGCRGYNLVDPDCPPLGRVADLVAAELGGKPPRRIPLPVLRATAVLGDVLESVLRRAAPLSSSRLDAMLEHQPLDDAPLRALGFRFPESTEAGLTAFVQWYRTSTSSP